MALGSRSTRLGVFLIMIPMAYLGAAGIGKAVDPLAFGRVLSEWTLLPRVALPVLSIAVPLAEIGLACCWFVGIGRRYVAWIAACLIGLFLLIYLIHLVVGYHPSCGCAGAWEHWMSFRESAPTVIVRDSGLILLLATGQLIASRQQRKRQSTPCESPVVAKSERTTPLQQPAFTIIELLLVITTLGVLFSLGLGTLRGSRAPAREAVTLANLKSHAAILLQYTADHHDQFPFFADPAIKYTTVRNDATGIEHDVPFFGQHFSWNFALAAEYYDNNWWQACFTSPDSREGGTWATQYYYGCCFVASAPYWNPLTRTGPKQVVPTRSADVLFPSSKGLLHDSYGWFDTYEGELYLRQDITKIRMATTDGAAAVQKVSRYMNGSTGDGKLRGAMHGVSAWPLLHHTQDGVRGRDLP